jgi:hypothetical protein
MTPPRWLKDFRDFRCAVPTIIRKISRDDLVPDTAEQWRDIPGHEGAYQVSDQGRVQSLTRSWIQISRHGTPYMHTMHGRLLKPGPTPSGHLSVALGRSNSQFVHALVLKAFVGPGPAGMEIRHLDGNEQNNCLSNLEYATRTRNSQDKKWHRGAIGYVLKPANVFDIKQRLGPWGMGAALAREYHVTQSTISAIKHGRFHKDCVP